MIDSTGWPALVAAAGWPAGLAAVESTRGFEVCRRIVASRARNFAFAFLFLPGRERLAMCALYAYCRLADDIADADAVALPLRRAALAELRRALDEALAGSPEGPLMTALGATVRRFGIRREDLVAILDGVAMDLEGARFPDVAALHRYCHGVASAVGLAAIEIFGHRGGSAREHALALGVALQLTNVLRDVREDALRGRVYLPDDWLALHGVSAESILAGAPTGDIAGLLDRLARAAREQFALGAKLLPLVRSSTRACPATLGALYRALLDEIERRGATSVLTERVRLGSAAKLAIAAKCWLRHGVARQ